MNKYFKNLATILFTVSVLTTSIIASPAMASAYEESHNVSTIYTSPLDTPHVGDTKITGKPHHYHLLALQFIPQKAG